MSGIVNSLLRATTASPVSYRSVATNGNSSRVTKPSGVAVDDIVLVWAHYIPTGTTLTTVSGAAWARTELAWAAHGYKSVLFWKKLDAADVANFWDLSATASEGLNSVAYQSNGATTVTVKSTTANPINREELDLAAFTPDPLSRGVASFFADRDSGSTPTGPSGFTSRFAGQQSNFYVAGADKITGYAGGTVVWSDTTNFVDYFAEVGFLVEFT